MPCAVIFLLDISSVVVIHFRVGMFSSVFGMEILEPDLKLGVQIKVVSSSQAAQDSRQVEYMEM